MLKVFIVITYCFLFNFEARPRFVVSIYYCFYEPFFTATRRKTFFLTYEHFFLGLPVKTASRTSFLQCNFFW